VSKKNHRARPARKRHTGSSKANKAAFHQRFVNAYFTERENATRAYLTVKPHVTERTASSEGHKLLRLPDIHEAIEKRREEIRQRFAFTADRVMQELSRLAYFNSSRMLNEKGKPKRLHELDEDTTAALTLEIDGKGKVLRVRTPPTSSKNTAVRQAVRILRLEDKPPPPPPDPAGDRVVDQRDTARRLAFMLKREDVAVAKDNAPAARKAKKKLEPA
jgi:hypothetical protein